MEIPNIYKGNYKLLAIFPLALIALSLLLIPNIKLGVDFTGGTLISLNLKEKVDPAQLKAALASEGLEANVRVFDSAIGQKAEIELPQSEQLVAAEQMKGDFAKQLENVQFLEAKTNTNASTMEEYIAARKTLNALADDMFILAGMNTQADAITNLNTLQKNVGEAYGKVYSNYRDSVSSAINEHASYTSISIQTVSPVLSTHFIDQAKGVMLWAGILSLVFVFFFFRTIVPSIAVLCGAAADVILAMGAMSLFGIPFTLPSFAALLMLVGFSLDTDVLLTMRMLKRKGDPREKAFDAMKTGMTMSIMAIVAFGALFILGTLTHISTYYEISAVALAGLVGDLFATWGINGVMLLWYVESRGEA